MKRAPSLPPPLRNLREDDVDRIKIPSRRRCDGYERLTRYIGRYIKIGIHRFSSLEKGETSDVSTTVYVTVERLHTFPPWCVCIFVLYRKESRRKDAKGRERGKSDVKGRRGKKKKKTKRVSTYFVVDCDPRDRLCSRSGTPRSMLPVQGQRTGTANRLEWVLGYSKSTQHPQLKASDTQRGETTDPGPFPRPRLASSSPHSPG